MRLMRLRMTPYTLNLLDLALTLYAISHGAVELNPLMRCIPLQVVYKVVIVGALCYALHRFAEGGNMIARYGLRIATVVYGGVFVWHLVNLV